MRVGVVKRGKSEMLYIGECEDREGGHVVGRWMKHQRSMEEMMPSVARAVEGQGM